MKLQYLIEHERIQIIPENNTELRGIKSYLDRYVDGYMNTPEFKMKLWNGKKSRYHIDTNTIPLGLWKEAFKCCEEFGYPFRFINKEDFPLNRGIKKAEFYAWVDKFFTGFLYKGKQFEVREYQKRCAFNILKNRYCNIRVATSGGKTLIYALVMFWLMKKDPTAKFLLVVPSMTLVNQFYDDIYNFNWNNELSINAQEIFGEGQKPRTNDVTKEPNFVIGTFQSLVKYDKKYFLDFDSVTVDEGHKSKATSYRKILKKTFNHAVYRWGMSGTFPDDSTYEMMEIMARTGPVVDNVGARELMDAGYITQVKIKGVLMYHNNFQFADNLENVASRDRKSCYDLECAMLQESEERLGVINQIVRKCKTNTLVLFHNAEYGEKILKHLQENNPDKIFHFINGPVSKKNRNAIKADMELTDKVRVLVASFGTLSTGVSIDAIHNVLFCQSFKKEQVVIQSIGRALRLHPDKKLAYIFDLVDVFNQDQFASRVKKSFKNILHTHWDKRAKIYDGEDYPYDTIEVQLQAPI